MRRSVMHFIKDEPMLLVQVLSKYWAVLAWRGPLTDKGSESVQPELDFPNRPYRPDQAFRLLGFS
jgi:hypothetical protein